MPAIAAVGERLVAQAMTFLEQDQPLMIDVVNRSYAFLTELFNSPSGDRIIESLKQGDELPRWNDPQSP